ncbi:hypothetical protein F5146DRAFT_1074633 [Armillaria mellea]|nr:hypothetical protein F5146DRAFT_1074633 [Armillaria mellea]
MEHDNYTEVTLSAFAETGRVESSIPVLKQRSYTGRKPVMSSALANTPCADLGVDGMLEKLNATLGTSYNLDSTCVCGKVLNATPQENGNGMGRLRDLLYIPLNAISRQPLFLAFAQLIPRRAFPSTLTKLSFDSTRIATLRSVFKSYIAQSYDFGTAYAYLRPYCHEVDSLQALKERVDSFNSRWEAPHPAGINKDTVPRRIWDLYANRVVPSWVTPDEPRGISHAWVDEKDRMDMMTPINGNKWPVPMPKDANLDLIRIELLNTGVEYAWLDVLCLRQEGRHNKHLRTLEWKIDVPTIGNVYYGGVVCYFCGLGRPLVFEDGYFESDRCWFNRAWTLQEVPCTNDDSGISTVVCGETGNEDIHQRDIRSRVDEKLVSLRRLRNDRSLFAILSEMQKRVSAKLLDKIAGLAYVIGVQWLPVYDLQFSAEYAWTRLVWVMHPCARGDLFFYYPEPGNGVYRWRPSWTQVMTQILPLRGEAAAAIRLDNMRSFISRERYRGPRIMSGEVYGLEDQSNNENPRYGQLVVKDSMGTPHSIKVIASHQYPIPQGLYTLMGSNGDADIFMKYWVVGHQRKRNRFKKLSVIRLADEDGRRKLQKLGVAKQGCRVFLM